MNKNKSGGTELERDLYLKRGLLNLLSAWLLGGVNYEVYRFIYHMRRAEYFAQRDGWINRICYLVNRRAYNIKGRSLGLEIYEGCFGDGLKIYHPFGIVVHPRAEIGKDCKLHGNNCIGNNGRTDVAPKIGDNVDIGVGACILGDVTIADNVTIGANALVLHSCKIDGAVLIGSPARPVKTGV